MMRVIKSLLCIIAVLFSTVVLAQEHGPIVGGSMGKLHEKLDVISSDFRDYKFHYHVGYAYRQYLGNKFAIDGIALFGSQGSDYQYWVGGSPIIHVMGKYVSLGTVVSYECFPHFRVGLGADVAWYVDKLGSSAYNKKNAIDVPLVARISYSLKWFEVQLAYKHGTCSLMDTETLGKMTSRDIQLSLFVPLFKK